MIPGPARTAFKRFLRSPATIVGELLFITALGGLGAALPQTGVAPAAEVARLRSHGAFVTALVDAMALDHVFTSPAFLIALGMATASLSLVVVEQIRRLRVQWNVMPTEAHFRQAPFRREFTRPASPDTTASTRIRARGRLGLAGSPLFHAGLLCVILAGGLRALFGAEAVVDLYEGETLPATVEAWGAQWPGPLGQPFRLEDPLRLEAVERASFRTGELQDLRLKLAVEPAEGGQARELGVNEEIRMSRGRLYVDAQHGPAALVEWSLPSAPPLRAAVLLEQKEPRAFGAYAQGPQGFQARIRAVMPEGGQRPVSVQVRLMEGPATLMEATLKPGEAMPLPHGGHLRLHGLPYWARLHGDSDPALGLAYLGFLLALLGAALTYGVIRVDEFVSVMPEGEVERVVVALRPHRFAPLYHERFERLVRKHGGEV